MDGGGIGRGDFQDGQVRARIGADDDGGINFAIVGGHPDIFRIADDMLVGEDVAVGINEEAGADHARGALEQVLQFLGIEMIGAERVIGIDSILGCGNGDDGGGDALGDLFEFVLQAGELERIVAVGGFGGGRRIIGGGMLVGRFLFIIPALAIAGSLAGKKLIPVTSGTLPTNGSLFVILLIGTVMIVGALTYFPALSLGPIVEHLQMLNGKLF